MIRIESKFVAINHLEVIKHRRIVTPLFYINLPSVSYRFGKSFIAMFGICQQVNCWANQKTNENVTAFTDRDTLEKIEAAIKVLNE